MGVSWVPMNAGRARSELRLVRSAGHAKREKGIRSKRKDMDPQHTFPEYDD